MTRKVSTGRVGQTNIRNIASVSFDQETVAPISPNADLVLDANGTGVVTTADPFTVSNNTASTTTASGAVVVTGGVGIAGNLNVAGSLNIGGSGINGTTFGTVTPAAASFTALTHSGLFSLAELTESITSISGASGVVAHNFAVSSVFFHTSIAANFTVNVTNFSAVENRITKIQLILVQGSTAYLPNAIQIDGVSQTIRWSGYNPPNVNSNKTEVVTFQIVRSGGSYTVYAALSSFGQTLDGSSDVLAAPSAAWIRRANPAAANGVYWIDHGNGAYQNYCYMDAGGHLLVGKIASTTSSGSPWMYSGSYWGTTTAQNESTNQNLTSADGVTRAWFNYNIQTNLRLCLGSQTNALTYPISGVTCQALFTGGQRDTNSLYSRAQFLNWFTTGTGISQTVFDNQPFCNRSGINRTDSSAQGMRFGITMNNENDCNSNDSSVGFGVYTNGQVTGPRAVPAGGFRWNPDAQYPAVGYIFAQ